MGNLITVATERVTSNGQRRRITEGSMLNANGDKWRETPSGDNPEDVAVVTRRRSMGPQKPQVLRQDAFKALLLFLLSKTSVTTEWGGGTEKEEMSRFGCQMQRNGQKRHKFHIACCREDFRLYWIPLRTLRINHFQPWWWYYCIVTSSSLPH